MMGLAMLFGAPLLFVFIVLLLFLLKNNKEHEFSLDVLVDHSTRSSVTISLTFLRRTEEGQVCYYLQETERNYPWYVSDPCLDFRFNIATPNPNLSPQFVVEMLGDDRIPVSSHTYVLPASSPYFTKPDKLADAILSFKNKPTSKPPPLEEGGW